MTPPAGTIKPASSGNKPVVSATDERKDHLGVSKLVGDSRWENPDFRSKHLKLYFAINSLNQFMEGKVSAEKLQKAVEAWKNSPEYSDPANKEFYQAVTNNIYAQLRKFSVEENTTRAIKVREFLPEEKVKKPEVETPAPKKEDDKKEEEKKGGDKHFSVGLEVHNDTFVSDVLLKHVFQVDIDSVMSEKTDFTLKVPFTFGVGDFKLMARPYGGMFQGKGIPGTEAGSVGRGYKFGADFGFVNPYGKRFEASGIGIEGTGIHDFAGQANGIEAPDPVVRLHFFRQNDLAWPIGNFQLSLNSFFNYQETFFVIGNNKQLLPEGEGTDFSTAGNIFANNKFNLLGIGLRYYPNGAPQGGTRDDLKGPFRPGESAPKIGNVLVGNLINRNRRRGIPPFANNRVFLGTFEPLGQGSRDQYDLLGTGLSLYSFLDGNLIASNATDRAEIWRRGNWTERGLMIGVDGVRLVTDIVLAATAKGDPDFSSVQAFADNPGMVTDFEGRAGKMNLYLGLYELGLSGLDASGALGRIYDDNLIHYGIANGALFALGIPLFFLSAPISGVDCAPDGTALFRCGFGTTANTQGQYFSTDTFDAGPDDLKQVETQYIVSAIGASMISKGASSLINLLLIPSGEKSKASAKKGDDSAFVPSFNLQVSPNGGMLTLGGRM